MLNAVIRFSLRYRLLTISLALVAICYVGYALAPLPIVGFPDLPRPLEDMHHIENSNL